MREPDVPLPNIPTERELDQLIAGMSNKYATFLQLLKESAFRPGEAMSARSDEIVKSVPSQWGLGRMFS